MTQLAQGNFQIKKLIDGKTVSFSISTSKGDTQIMSKDPVSFNPDYSKSAQVISPFLSVSGSEGNQIAVACKWFINGEELQGTNGTANKTKWGAVVGTVAPFTLTLSKNMTDVSSMTIRAEYRYTDPVSGAYNDLVVEKTISKVENTGAAIMAHVSAPSGDKFYVKAGAVQDLLCRGRMIRGGDDDITDVAYKWSISVGGAYFPITAATAPAGSNLPAGTLFAGWTTGDLTVKSTAVLNVATFKCEITDTDNASSTKGKTVTGYVTLYDATDPYQINVRQPQGDGVTTSGSAKCVFEVLQKGIALPDSFYTSKTLKFFRNTAAGVADTTWVPSPVFTGWTVAAGVVSRLYAAGQGTEANRSVSIFDSHLLPTTPVTVFGISLEG